MSKGFLVAFVCLVGAGTVGVDYVNQAKRAGVAPNAFGADAYMTSISARYFDYRRTIEDEAKRSALLQQKRRELLPEAPDGWARHVWGEADERLFGTDRNVALPDELKDEPTLTALMEMDRKMVQKLRTDQSYVYEKDGESVAVLIHYDRTAGQGGMMGGPFMSLVNGNIEALSGKTGFAVVQGVTFRRDFGVMNFGQDEAPDADPATVTRAFSANLNSQIRIAVTARARDEAIFEVLSAIDFDQLNFLLDAPIEGIGAAAPTIPWERQKAEADARVAADSAAQVMEAIDNNQKLLDWAKEVSERHKGKLPSEAEYAAEVTQMNQIGGAAEPAAAPAGEAAAETAKGGGFLSIVNGLFGKGATEETADAEEQAPAKPAVGSFGSGNCTMQGAVKRCSASGG
ncbi:hypothetical protein [Frigidibacter sp. SD6-1]|uniref:hypothetical protein n=1 Tax=Frigidibacter sp. SD6-1 TaxID=3032581 RepID=UPI0024E01A6E|nr:hypothetical protein [Frigidibacter sp. SD6-1]